MERLSDLWQQLPLKILEVESGWREPDGLERTGWARCCSVTSAGGRGGPRGAVGKARAYSLSRGLWLEEDERNRHSVGADPREEQMLAVKAKNSPAGDRAALGIQNLLRPGPSEASPVIAPTFAATISSSSLYRWKSKVVQYYGEGRGLEVSRLCSSVPTGSHSTSRLSAPSPPPLVTRTQ